MFTVIYNNAAGILRAVGDSRTPFRILVLACGVNIVLDVVLTGALRLGVTLTLSALVYVFARACVALFNPEPEVVGVGVAMVRVLALMFWVMAVREVLLGYLRGYGRSFVPMVLSLIGMIGVRQVYLAVTLRTAQPEIVHIYRCYPIAWAATTGLLFVYYLLVRKKLSRRRSDQGKSAH